MMNLFAIKSVSAQEGKTFLLAFPPVYTDDATGECQIIINANSQAEVSISYEDVNDNISVGIGSYVYDTPCTLRISQGYSNKAVKVQSSVDISVQVHTNRFAIGDVYLALPLKDRGAEYILSTPPAPCNNKSSRFMIAAETDNTQVDVYVPSPGGYKLADTVTLNKYGTYSNASALDYTGWKLSSSAPVSVVTGSACFKMNTEPCTRSNSGYISMPTTEEAGYNFAVPQITFQNSENSGSFIRVISFSQNNVVRFPDQSVQQNLNSGEYYQHRVSAWTSITRIICSEQCIVVLYNEVTCYLYGLGNFLMYITPLERRASYSRFAALRQMSFHLTGNYVTIVSDTTNVNFDNQQIEGFEEIPDSSYYTVRLQIEHGGHLLESSDDGKFVAFLIGHAKSFSIGYGLQLVHGGLAFAA